MNKSKMLAYMIIFVLLVSGIVATIYFATQAQDNSGSHYENEKTDGRTDVPKATNGQEIKKEDREVTINGKIYELKYNRNTGTANNSDGYGFYDVYIDELNNDYFFLSGSDLLCSFIFYNPVEEESEEIISMEEATEEAIGFLKNNISGCEDYILEPEASYCELSGRSYAIQFSKQIGGYKTDDTAIVRISKYNKQLNGFSARNMKRYDKVELTEEQIKAAERKLEDSIESKYKGEYEINLVYISKDESGNVIIAKGVCPIIEGEEGEEPFLGEGEIYTQIID